MCFYMYGMRRHKDIYLMGDRGFETRIHNISYKYEIGYKSTHFYIHYTNVQC